MRKLIFVLLILVSNNLFKTSKSYSQIFIGGGYFGNYLGYNGVLEYRFKIASSNFYINPAVSYNGNYNYSRFINEKVLQNNLDLSTNFSYSFAPLMNIHFMDLRVGTGFIAGIEFSPTRIMDDNLNFVFGAPVYVSLAFLVHERIALGFRQSLNFYFNSKYYPIQNPNLLLSVGLFFKIK
ncbi:MAG: hypothetical protein ACRCR9_00375 [Chitinophagaceae bacterium]